MVELYRVPQPDENTEELTLGEWYVSEGDVIEEEMPICQMIAQKGDFDFLALHNAVLLKQLASAGSVIPVGYIFAIVGDATESAPDVSAENDALLQSRGMALTGTRKVRATPSARRLAKEHGVDLAAVKSTLGISGAIKPEHIQRYLESQS